MPAADAIPLLGKPTLTEPKDAGKLTEPPDNPEILIKGTKGGEVTISIRKKFSCFSPIRGVGL